MQERRFFITKVFALGDDSVSAMSGLLCNKFLPQNPTAKIRWNNKDLKKKRFYWNMNGYYDLSSFKENNKLIEFFDFIATTGAFGQS